MFKYIQHRNILKGQYSTFTHTLYIYIYASIRECIMISLPKCLKSMKSSALWIIITVRKQKYDWKCEHIVLKTAFLELLHTWDCNYL